MTQASSIATKLPPRLSMDEYADFVEASLLRCDLSKAARQKEIEEQIQVPFRIPKDT